MHEPPLLQTKGLAKSFAGMPHQALQPVDLGLQAGTITGLAGPDGAGKTTLLRLIAGLLTPDSGEIRVAGHDPVREAGQVREITGYMPQKFGLYEELTVMENLLLHADLRGLAPAERGQRFARLLDFTDLGAFTTRRAGALSGGMKQKLGLACALLGSPKLLLLDEPSVGVDPVSRRELWKMVRALMREGIAVIWSTAYLDEVENCDAVLLLNEGRPLFLGKPSELTGRVRNRSWLVRGVTRDRRVLLTELLDHAGVIDGVIQGDDIRIVLAQAGGTAAVTALAQERGGRMEPAEPRFEDAFIDLLGGGPGGTSVLAANIPEKRHREGAAAVEARGLTKRFGDFTATSGIDFSIRPGEIFGLLGPNGAGKSTTFKMMCGLLKPTAGEALVTGISLSRAPAAARQRVGYMAQKFSLYGNLTVRQNLDFFSGVYGLRGARRREQAGLMTRLFGLEPYLDRSSAELPLGIKQRLALSCAVMHGPDILFLDEPTSGVDPVTRREFWSHINGMVRRGVTVMVTTHFMDEAEYCDRIGLVYRGRLIALGTPQELKRLAAAPGRAHPTLEDAFIALIERTGTAEGAA